MKYINRRSILSEKYPPIISPIIEQLGYDSMTEARYEILLRTVIGQEKGNKFTRAFLRKLK